MRQETTFTLGIRDKIEGLEVRPGSMPLPLLCEFVQQSASFLKAGIPTSDQNQILMDVKEGSFVLSAVLPITAAMALSVDMEIMRQGGDLTNMTPARAKIIMEWQENASKQPTRSYQIGGSMGVQAIIDATTNFTLDPILVHAERYVVGSLIRWGGKDPKIHIIPEGEEKILIIDASEEQIREVKDNLLYREVMVHIDTEEDLKTKEIIHARLISFIEYDPVWDEAAYQRLVTNGTKAWADVEDPNVWVDTLRGNI